MNAEILAYGFRKLNINTPKAYLYPNSERRRLVYNR